MHRGLVDHRRWLGERRPLDALIALSTFQVVEAQVPLLAGVFWALNPVVPVIVPQATWRIGRRTLHHPAHLAVG